MSSSSVPVVLESLREDGEDDRHLTWRENLARALAMLPITVAPLVWVSVRPSLPFSTTGAVGLLIAWFLLGAALMATVIVRTRRRARARRRRGEKAARRAARQAVLHGKDAAPSAPSSAAHERPRNG